MRVPFMRRYSSQIGSPMQRSGVALANAEATWKGSATPPEDSDGILTAAEVATLDLRKTRLATLSACETALGAYNFEGIHGLTRGFQTGRRQVSARKSMERQRQIDCLIHVGFLPQLAPWRRSPCCVPAGC